MRSGGTPSAFGNRSQSGGYSGPCSLGTEYQIWRWACPAGSCPHQRSSKQAGQCAALSAYCSQKTTSRDHRCPFCPHPQNHQPSCPLSRWKVRSVQTPHYCVSSCTCCLRSRSIRFRRCDSSETPVQPPPSMAACWSPLDEISPIDHHHTIPLVSSVALSPAGPALAVFQVCAQRTWWSLGTGSRVEGHAHLLACPHKKRRARARASPIDSFHHGPRIPPSRYLRPRQYYFTTVEGDGRMMCIPFPRWPTFCSPSRLSISSRALGSLARRQGQPYSTST